MKKLLFFLTLTLLGQLTSAQVTYNVMDFGALQDKDKISTAAIQAAVDSCYFQGGGTVYFPPGEYCSGTIVLKDNVTFYLEAGATLFASRNINDYRAPLEDAIRPMLIYANGAKNITIKGKGTLDGNAERVYEDLRRTDVFIKHITKNAREAGVEMKQYYWVPPAPGLFTLARCSNVTIEDIRLNESAFWGLHIIRSERIFIRGVHINSSLESGVNSDGIDINSCRDVVISDCIISTGDDAIVLKSWYEDPCENVTVSNCVLSSSSTALKLGTESEGDMRHIHFDNCVVRNSNRGLSIVVRDGAMVEDIMFTNITIDCSRRHFNWWGNGDPIWIYLTKRRQISKVGYIKNVVFENVIAKGQGTSKIESTEGVRIENIQLNNVQLEMEAESEIDKRADHAFFANNVKDLKLNNVTVKWDDSKPEEKWKSAIAISNTSGLTIDNFSGRQGLLKSNEPVIDLLNTNHALIKNCLPDEGSNSLVKVSGEASHHVFTRNNDPFGRANQELEVGSDVIDKSSVKSLNP